MQEYLLGYLLGALEDDEQEMVDEQLRNDPRLQQALEELRQQLEPLESLRGEYEPPEGLAAVTCERIAANEQAAVMPRNREWSGPLSGGPPRWRITDMVVAASIVAAAALLFFPAIANSRHAARLTHCQNNLRELGVALASYSDRDAQRRFPPVATSGNRACAGIAAPQLVADGLVDPNTLLCPGAMTVAGRTADFRIPTLEEIDSAQGAWLRWLQARAGGDYGYPLGHVQQGMYVSPRNLARSSFPIMTDAPSHDRPYGHSLNHGGNEHNVLYEAGNVRHIVGALAEKLTDDPLRNRRGDVAAGLDVNDAVIGTSATPPLPRGR